MSTGMVICSQCGREVHQNGPRDVRNGWRHCRQSGEQTGLCNGAIAVYPKRAEDVKGWACQMDGPLPASGAEAERDRLVIGTNLAMSAMQRARDDGKVLQAALSEAEAERDQLREALKESVNRICVHCGRRTIATAPLTAETMPDVRDVREAAERAATATTRCYRCQMQLPLRLTRTTIGPRGGGAVDVCAACSPYPGPEGEARRSEVVSMRRARLATAPPTKDPQP